MSTRREWAEASIQLDELKIVEDSKHSLKVQAVIVKSGVYDYPEGAAYKCPKELLKATRTARTAKLVVGPHPHTLMVMDQDHLFGGVEKPFWDRNKMRAVLNFDKDVTPESFQQRIRDATAEIGKALNVSIGFYYRPDHTTGMAKDVNTGKTRKYDFIMRGIVIDHVAVGDFRGRCRAPQCGIGIGIDGYLKQIYFQQNIVAKRGSQWCVIHHTPGPDYGKPLKGGCFATKEEADRMHRAIQARKHGGSADFYSDIGTFIQLDALTNEQYQLLFAAERPPKAWMDNCMSKSKSFADEPGAFCNWLWNEGPERLKQGFGGSSVQIHGGRENMSEEENGNEYDDCIKEKKAQGMSDAEAEEACKAFKPAEGTEGAQDEDEQTPWQKCIKKYTDKGKTVAEAIEACKAEGIAKTDAEESEEAQRQECIKGKMEIDGMTREEATEACTPTPEADQEGVESEEVLPTPLEQCVTNRMDTHGEGEAAATAWCKDELAGLHKPAEEIVDSITDLAEKERKLSRRRV